MLPQHRRGIMIGLDAVNRLYSKPCELIVLYYDSDASPCACFADGVAIATYASVVPANADRRAGESAGGGGYSCCHSPAAFDVHLIRI